MDVRALRYFVETVSCASFTQAARKLFVTQSTVSKMIRQLEDEVGTPLLIRDGHTARPTDTGRIVYERGLHILGAMRQLSTEVRQAVELERGELEVGIPPMINLLFIPVVQRFRERYPQIKLSLREGTGQAVERLVAAGEIEVGATVLPVPRPVRCRPGVSAAIRFGPWARPTPTGQAKPPCPWARCARCPCSSPRKISR